MGGKYRTYEVIEDCIMYRAGTISQPKGRFLSFERPISEVQTRIDKAVLDVWPNGGISSLDTGYVLKIPKGTRVHIGNIAPQKDLFLGGTKQIFIEKEFLKKIKIVHSYTLNQEISWFRKTTTP